MSLNISEINVHVTLLQQQSAEASHVARLLSLYKSELPYFWSGEEVEILCRVLEAQRRDCEKLYGELSLLCSDIVQAVKSIQNQNRAGTLEIGGEGHKWHISASITLGSWKPIKF